MDLGPSGLDIDQRGQILVNYRGGDMFLLGPPGGGACPGSELGEVCEYTMCIERLYVVIMPIYGHCSSMHHHRRPPLWRRCHGGRMTHGGGTAR